MGLWRKIKNVFGIGDVEAENNEFSSEKILDNKNENGVLKLNQVENFLKDKKIDKKWFPYRCQRLSEKLKDYYVLSMDEFKDVVSKALKRRLEKLINFGSKDLENAYKKWEKASKGCEVMEGDRGVVIPQGGAVTLPLKVATQNYWDAVRDILSKPIMNESYVNQLIEKVQGLTPAEKILEEHGCKVSEKN